MAAIIIFSVLNGWMLMTGLRQNNAWSSALALLAIGCSFYFIYLYHKLLTTPPDEAEPEMNDSE